MSNFLVEPRYQHGQLNKIGVILVNLGSPEAPTAHALRPYLKQFLSDPRVVEIPKAIWWFILNGIILNTRPKKSAEKYASIWTENGSPLAYYTSEQAKKVEAKIHAHIQQPITIRHAMRYGQPSIESVLTSLQQEGCDRLLIFPLYPQYSASTTATVHDTVFRHLQKVRNQPAVRTVKHYHDDPRYIGALVQQVEQHFHRYGQPDKLLMSFHGVPLYTLEKGDPYHCECHKTARLVAEGLNLRQEEYLVTFQSRFGKAKWIEPYTAPTVIQLAKQQTERIDILCPGFVSDCLETLEEIAMEVKGEFLQAGGKQFNYIPCLNLNDTWIDALTGLIIENLQGWLDPKWDRNTAMQAAKNSHAYATAKGAKQ